MKRLIECWKEGLYILRYDDCISFYMFFTFIFSECIFLWTFGEPTIVKPLAIVLLGYVINVLACSFIRAILGETRIGVIVSIVYLIVFIILFIRGGFINITITMIMTWIPLFITLKLTNDRLNGCCTRVHQFVVIALPAIVFTISILMTPVIPIALKVIIPILYVLLAPFIPCIEDEMAVNMFELFFEVDSMR